MARPAAHAITDVERIAKQLKSQNKQVTPYRVQKLLGGGSFAWVKSALDQLGYHEDLGLPAGIDDNTLQLLRVAQPFVDHLTQQARSEMDAAVEKLEKAADDQEEIRKNLEEELADQKKQNSADRNALQQTQTSLLSAQDRISELEKSLNDSENRLRVSETRVSELETQLQDKQSQLATLRNDRQQEREDFASQRKALRAEHDASISRLELLRREAVQESNKQRTLVQSLTGQNASLVSEIKALQESYRKVDAERAEVSRELEKTLCDNKKESADQMKKIMQLEIEIESFESKAEEDNKLARVAAENQKTIQRDLYQFVSHFEHLSDLLPEEDQVRSIFTKLLHQANGILDNL